MSWTVTLTKKVAKAIPQLPTSVKQSLFVLLGEIESSGPIRGNWKNYSKLGSARHHCHLKKGQPTYVAVWNVTNKEIKLIEVIYVGSHEKAPY